MSSSAQLKALQVKQTKVKEDLAAIRTDFDAFKKLLVAKEKELEEVNRQIKNLKNKEKDLVVSEHAILRYIERHNGIDMDMIRRAILSDIVVGAAKALGNGEFPIVSGMPTKAVVKDGVVVTVKN